jgi:hypothetical protein
MSATAGKLVRLKMSGAAVAFVTEACTDTGDGKTYQITNAAKRVLDPTASISVYYNGVLKPASSYTLNRLAGTITFASAPGALAVTVTGSYLPMTTIAEGKSFSFATKTTTLEDVAFGDTDITRAVIEKMASGTIGMAWLDNAFHAAFVAGGQLVVEIATASGATPIARAWALLTERSHDGSAAAWQEEGLTWESTPDADGRSFAWLL